MRVQYGGINTGQSHGVSLAFQYIFVCGTKRICIVLDVVLGL